MTVPINSLPPSPMQVAHDLRAQAIALDGRHLQGEMMDQLCRSLRRGAATIEHLVKTIADGEGVKNGR